LLRMKPTITPVKTPVMKRRTAGNDFWFRSQATHNPKCLEQANQCKERIGPSKTN
jgi:hypothetical protein